MSSTQDIYKSTNQATLPWETVYNTAKSVVIDSRQRDCSRFKNPAYYTLDLEHTFRNISSIELKGAIFPKSSYNIHSSNNNIDFVIGDAVTSFQIIDRGAGYTSAPSITISSPTTGTTATATAVINSGGQISTIILQNGGSGYIPSTPPFIFIDPPTNTGQARYPKIIPIVGNHYTATLRRGEYEIGGNPNPPTTAFPNNLLLEIQNAMNYAVNGPPYNPVSTSPFAVRLVSQYPELGSITGTPESFDTNACLFNRIQVINTNSDTWQFLWCTGPNKITSMASVMGFNTVDSPIGVPIPAVVTNGYTLIPAGTAIRGYFDYNLKNSPDYVIMSIKVNQHSMDRLKSPDDGLDDSFAVLLFDNNCPETLHDLTAALGVTSINGVQCLAGPTGKGLFWRDSGFIKPIKGTDFEAKKLSFKPPISSVTNITIQFTKFGYKAGGVPLFYNMEGHEHVLLFEFSSTDNRSQRRE